MYLSDSLTLPLSTILKSIEENDEEINCATVAVVARIKSDELNRSYARDLPGNRTNQIQPPVARRCMALASVDAFLPNFVF